MSYIISIAKELDIENDQIIYDKQAFAPDPVQVSVPGLLKVIEPVVTSFSAVDIVDPRSESDGSSNTTDLGNTEVERDQAYVTRVADFEEEDLDWLLTTLVEFLETEAEEMSRASTGKEMLEPEWSPSFSGLSQVSDLRNLLATYFHSKKEKYQDGYLFVMEV